MNPRLSTSKKWTAFPADFVEQIREALVETFQAQLKGARLIVEGRIYPGEILLRVGFVEENRLKQNNFEVSIDYQKEGAIDRIHDAIDVAASMMADFFEAEGEMNFPLQWKEYDFESIKVFCQYSTVNTELEAEADRLLGESDPSLVKVASEDDEAGEDPDTPPQDKSKLH